MNNTTPPKTPSKKRQISAYRRQVSQAGQLRARRRSSSNAGKSAINALRSSASAEIIDLTIDDESSLSPLQDDNTSTTSTTNGLASTSADGIPTKIYNEPELVSGLKDVYTPQRPRPKWKWRALLVAFIAFIVVGIVYHNLRQQGDVVIPVLEHRVKLEGDVVSYLNQAASSFGMSVQFSPYVEDVAKAHNQKLGLLVTHFSGRLNNQEEELLKEYKTKFDNVILVTLRYNAPLVEMARISFPSRISSFKCFAQDVDSHLDLLYYEFEDGARLLPMSCPKSEPCDHYNKESLEVFFSHLRRLLYECN